MPEGTKEVVWQRKIKKDHFSLFLCYNTNGDKFMKKKYLLYLFRWQLSTPILAIVLYLLHTTTLLETIIANLVGGLIFFWVDRVIFKN